VSAVRQKADLLTMFDERLTALEMLFTDVNEKAARQARTLLRHEQLLKLVDEHKATKILDSISVRVDELSERLQLEMLKLTVCSEVTRLYHEAWPQLVKALDLPDEWWQKGWNLSISDWHERLNQPYPLQ
jgi:hypothetical protein